MSTASPNPLLALVELGRRARAARSAEELAFLAVNDSHALGPYRQGALWFADRGVVALSGVVEPEANAPYVQWLAAVCRDLRARMRAAAPVGADALPPALANEWADWLPAHGLWLPLGDEGGVLLAADDPWPDAAIALMEEWFDAWHYAWTARHQGGGWSWGRALHAARAALAGDRERPWWKQRRAWIAIGAGAVLACPVRLSVLAPAELVPAHPAVIRAPVDGVIAHVDVQPNEAVKAGQPLISFDEAALAARMDVATQALATAQAEYRQDAQQALSDARSKVQLALANGKIEERRAEADYAKDLFARARVTAPQAGIVLFDDPDEWTGRPVQTGERIMRIASPGDVEIEAWLPLGDAIPLPDGARVDVYLAASPLDALSAHVRYIAHDAVARPDGAYAYRVRARLDKATSQRVGLKGTAKLSGERVPLVYWMLRRPLATIRQHLGL